MNINLNFSQIEVPDYLRVNIEGFLEEAMGDFSKNDKLFLELYCKKECKESKHHNDKFKCHLIADAPWMTKKVYVHAEGDECWETIVEATSKIKRKIFKMKRQRVTQRSKNNRLSDVETSEHEQVVGL